MKIIFGKHKNRIIPTSKRADYRPSTTKFREALFSIISSGEFMESQPVIGAKVLDLYAGSGSLSFEALSRGAASVTLIDKNDEHLLIAKKFAEKLGEEKNFTALVLNACNLPISPMKYDLVFMDPPYYNSYVGKSLQSLVNNEWLENGALIVVEVEIQASTEIPSELTLLKEKKYGNNKLLILKYEQN